MLPTVEYVKHAEKFELLGLCSKPNRNEHRCVFCEQDITMEGVLLKDCWNQHLLNKCMHNPRAKS